MEFNLTDSQNLLIIEKPEHKILKSKKIIKDISHDLKVLEDGQGGL